MNLVELKSIKISNGLNWCRLQIKNIKHHSIVYANLFLEKSALTTLSFLTPLPKKLRPTSVF